MKRRAAFSIAEVVAVVVITGMLAGIAVPRYAQFSAHQQVEAAARRLAVDLAYARRRATATSASQSVSFTSGSHSYVLSGVPDPDHPAGVYTVELDEEPYQARIVSAVFGGGSVLQYDAYGVPAGGVGGSVTIAVGPYRKIVTVDGTSGRVQVSEVTIQTTVLAQTE